MNAKDMDVAIIELARKAKLDAWNAFVEELKVPSELFPALMTNRPEMVRLAPRRPLSAEEADALYNLIAGLIETNSALREHAAQVATLVQDWMSGIHGLISTARKVRQFARFEHNGITEGDDV